MLQERSSSYSEKQSLAITESKELRGSREQNKDFSSDQPRHLNENKDLTRKS